MSEPRVLLVLGPSSGGIRRHVATLRDGLRDRGWAVTTAGPAAVLDDLGGLDHDVPIGWSPRSLWTAARTLRRLASHVDVVHVHGLKAAVVSIAARVRPRVLTIHNVVLDDSAGASAPILRALEQRIPSRMDRTLAVSEEIRQRFATTAAFDEIAVVVPAGPSPHPDRSSAQVRRDLGVGSAPLVTTVARLHPQKDVPTLLRAARIVVDARPDTRFVVVGGGPAEPELRALCVELGLGEAVQLVGQRPNAADELAAADVVALSSIWEGSPLVVAEALLLGRPVVATAVGAVPEAVIDGETGRLVPPRDPAALAAAIIELLDDPERAAVLAAAGHRVAVERFATDVLVDAVAVHYRGVLDEVSP